MMKYREQVNGMKVVIVDDDKLVCTSLKVILEMDPEIEVVAVGHDGTEAIELYKKYLPDVLLMDIRMSTMTGLEAGEKILAAHREAKILYLTTFSDDEYIVKALHIGAKGYILKQEYESIVPALKAVYINQSVFGGDIVSKLPHLIQNTGSFDYKTHNLTEKEFEMIGLIAEGLSNKEIAENMYLSEGTVRNYLSTILEKLNLRDRTQLAIYYYKNCK